MKLFLGGDVMTGRGIDQILPHPAGPRLYEPVVSDAREYVALAEAVNGPIARHVAYDYIWGDALSLLAEVGPDVRIINLETAVTLSGDAWPGKGIHYRMSPANVPCLTAAGIDCCTLANNHVLDWGQEGLRDTLESLHAAGIGTAGAGPDEAAAAAPAVIDVAGKGRVLVVAAGDRSSGIPGAWAARSARAGVYRLDDLRIAEAARIGDSLLAIRRPGDVAVFSIHWGGNWGYDVPASFRHFARQLLESGGVDIVCGHSSHHPKGIEVHRNRLILYGCGDLVNDYEGISGYEAYRSDLALMYLPVCDPGSGTLLELTLVPLRRKRLRLQRADGEETAWLAAMLNRTGAEFGTAVETGPDGTLRLRW